MAYLIVSMDGGGIRGVMTAALLREIEKVQPFLERVNLFAGTSTGGILALGLAKGMTPDELVKLYRDRGREIFSDRDLSDTLALRSDEAFRADYGTEGLKHVLQSTLGSGTLAQLQKRVLVSAFDLQDGQDGQWKPKFFHNYEGETSDGAASIVDVALRTSAAPTYFPSHQGYIDGGVVANNPSMCALAKAVKEKVALDDIKLLSIGTGFTPHHIAGTEHDWGKVQWGTRLLRLVFEGGQDVPDYQCRQLLPLANYRRLQFRLPKPYDLDAVDDVGDMLKLIESPNDDVKKLIANAAAFVAS